jgi:hypothetical protein
MYCTSINHRAFHYHTCKISFFFERTGRTSAFQSSGTLAISFYMLGTWDDLYATEYQKNRYNLISAKPRCNVADNGDIILRHIILI